MPEGTNRANLVRKTHGQRKGGGTPDGKIDGGGEHGEARAERVTEFDPDVGKLRKEREFGATSDGGRSVDAAFFGS